MNRQRLDVYITYKLLFEYLRTFLLQFFLHGQEQALIMDSKSRSKYLIEVSVAVQDENFKGLCSQTGRAWCALPLPAWVGSSCLKDILFPIDKGDKVSTTVVVALEICEINRKVETPYMLRLAYWLRKARVTCFEPTPNAQAWEYYRLVYLVYLVFILSKIATPKDV